MNIYLCVENVILKNNIKNFILSKINHIKDLQIILFNILLQTNKILNIKNTC